MWSRHAHHTHRNRTGASFAVDRRAGLRRWIVVRTPSRCPCDHPETEHESRHPHRGSSAVDNTSVQSSIVRSGDSGRDQARTSRMDTDSDIRRGKRRSIRRPCRSLLQRNHRRDRQHEREQHEHRGEYRHREDRPGTAFIRREMPNHRLPPTIERTARRVHLEPSHQPIHRGPSSGCGDADQLCPAVNPQLRSGHESGCHTHRFPASDAPRRRRRRLLKADLCGGQLHSGETHREHKKHGGDHRGKFRRNAAALSVAVADTPLSPRT